MNKENQVRKERACDGHEDDDAFYREPIVWRSSRAVPSSPNQPSSKGLSPKKFYGNRSFNIDYQKSAIGQAHDRKDPTDHYGDDTNVVHSADDVLGLSKSTPGTGGSRHRRRRRNDKDAALQTAVGIGKGDTPALASPVRRQLRPGQALIEEWHDHFTRQVQQQQQQAWSQQVAIQRSAYRQVTSWKTWPLQERAMQHFQSLLALHLGKSWEAAEPNNLSVPDASSSSSSSSTASLLLAQAHEPKRLMRAASISPSKSSTKQQYVDAFLAEQAIRGPVPVNQADSIFGSPGHNALWCMEPRIFSVEKSQSGKRKYLVGPLGRFMDIYWRKADRNRRHYYELIREQTPCRLYLDLEYSKATNPNLTHSIAEKVLDELLVELSTEIQTVYPSLFSAVPIDRTHVVDLDSSTDIKFSRHWIVHLPGGYLFADTAAVGVLVHQWVARLAEQQATGALASTSPYLHQYLFVQSAAAKTATSMNDRPTSTAAEPDTASVAINPSVSRGVDAMHQKACMIDLGVYTRNRLFRLMGSSKFGKPAAAALRIAKANQFALFNRFDNTQFYLPAMAQAEGPNFSALSAATEGDEEHQDEDDDNQDSTQKALEKFKASLDWSTHANALAQTLVVPVNATKIDYPILPLIKDDDLKSNKSSRTLLSRSGARIASCTAAPGSALSSSFCSFGPSPYPMVDDFVLHHLANRGGVPGSIRAWTVHRIPTGSKHSSMAVHIVYQMSRNRWCENVGRAHRSNNIVWTVDLELGQCIQSCHDPDCRLQQFKGRPVPLPPPLLEAVQDAIWEEKLVAELQQQEQLEQRHTDHHSAPSRSANDSCDWDNNASFEQALANLCIHDVVDSADFTTKRPDKPTTIDQVFSNHHPANPSTQPITYGSDRTHPRSHLELPSDAPKAVFAPATPACESGNDDDDDDVNFFQQAMLTHPDLFP